MPISRYPRTFVDVHVIQSVPPANINRDDTGSPKQAIYGGTRRARVSSQAWKRATRLALSDAMPGESLGVRTKRLADLVAQRLVREQAIDPEVALRVATAVVEATGITMDKKDKNHTSYLLFVGESQVDRIAAAVGAVATRLGTLDAKGLKTEAAKVDIKPILRAGHSLDVALFGRMVADLADLNVDASTQVAHAVSTHAVDLQFDYFTAVDDTNPAEETGAGMIGTIEFNSATLYRYATVAVHQLAETLEDTSGAVAGTLGFVEAFAKSIPGGYQNSFAHRTRPSLVLVVVRDDQPVNLVTAFERPVEASDGIESASVGRLASEFRAATAMWADEPRLVAATYDPGRTSSADVRAAFGDALTFDDMLGRLGSSLLGRAQVASE